MLSRVSCTHLATHPRWGLCSAHRPQGPLGVLGLTGVSQGTVAQPISGALRLLLHHAGGGVGGMGT